MERIDHSVDLSIELSRAVFVHDTQATYTMRPVLLVSPTSGNPRHDQIRSTRFVTLQLSGQHNSLRA